MAGHAGPVVVVVLVILAAWYLACIPMNAGAVARTAASATGWDRVWLSFAQDRPVLPAPHQIVGEMWRTVALMDPTYQRRGDSSAAE